MLSRHRRLLLPCAVILASHTAASQAGNSNALEAHLAAAQRAQSQANCHTAATEYHAAVQLLPGSAELRSNEAIALFCDGQFAPAITALHTALRLNPSLTTPHLFLGLASYHLGDLATAHQQLTSYLRHAPADATAHLWLGYTLAAQDQPEAAIAQFRAVLAHDPTNLDALYSLGLSSLDVAHRRSLELHTLDPNGSDLLHLSALQFTAAGDSTRAAAAEAEAATRAAVASLPEAQRARAAELAREAAAAQTQAQAAFGTILTTAPDSFRAHQVRGDALLAAQQDEAAIPEYQAVLARNPTLPGVHETLSECLVATGHFAEALTALKAERALSPVASARLLTRIGQAQHAMGDDTAAAHSLRDALGQPDPPPQALLLLAQVLLAQSHPADAVPLLQRFLTLRPDSAAAFYTLSRAYRTLGDRPAMTAALAGYQRTSQDARQRTLVAPLLADSPASSFSDTPTDTPATPK